MDAQKIVLPNEIMLAEVSALLDEGRPVVIMTKGCSMLPFIRGDKDSVELVKRDSYSEGDIVLSQISSGHYVLHRIFALDGDRVTLKGDGNLVGTESCLISDICGTAVAIIRPDETRRDCTEPRFERRSRRWRRSPYIVRRLFLAFYRRVIL